MQSAQPEVDTATASDTASDTATGPKTYSVHLATTSLLIPGKGKTAKIGVEVLDQLGQPANLPVAWTATDYSVIDVAADGTLTAKVDAGSTLVRATILGGSVQSKPCFVYPAVPATPVVLVDESHIGQAPALVGGVKPNVRGTRLEVVIKPAGAVSAASLKPGALLLARDDSTVAGRIVTAKPGASGVDVAFEMVSLAELFEELDLSSSGTLVSPSKPADFFLASEHKIGPFVCKVDGGTLNFTPLPDNHAEFTPSFDHDLHVKVSKGALQQLSVWARVKLAVDVLHGYKVADGVKRTVSCESKSKNIPIPLPGVAKLVLSVQLMLGLYGDLELTAKGVGWTGGFSVKGDMSLKAGASWVAGKGFSNLSDAEQSLKPKLIAKLSPGPDKWRVTAALTAPGVYAKIGVGKPFWLEALDGKKVSYLPLVEAKAGPKFSVDVMPPLGQALDPAYASNAAIAVTWTAGTTGELADALMKLLSPVDALLGLAKKYMPDFVGSSIKKVSAWAKKIFGGDKEKELKDKLAKKLKEAAGKQIKGKLQWQKTGDWVLFQTPGGKLGFDGPPDSTTGEVKGHVTVAKPKGLLGGIGLGVKEVRIDRVDIKKETIAPITTIKSGIAVDKKLPWTWTPKAGESPFQHFAAFIVPSFLPLPFEVDVASNGCQQVVLEVSDVVGPADSKTDAVDADVKMTEAFNTLKGLLQYHTSQSSYWGNMAVVYAKQGKHVQAANAIQLQKFHGAVSSGLSPELIGWAELMGSVKNIATAQSKLSGGPKADDWDGPLNKMKGPVQVAELPDKLATKTGFAAINWDNAPASSTKHSFILATKSGKKVPALWKHELKVVRGADKALLLGHKPLFIAAWCKNADFEVLLDGKSWVTKTKDKVAPEKTHDLWKVGEKHTIAWKMSCDIHDKDKFPSHTKLKRMTATLVQFAVTATKGAGGACAANP